MGVKSPFFYRTEIERRLKRMLYSELLENTKLQNMIGSYTGITPEIMFGLFKNYLEPIYMNNDWSSKGKYYKTLDKMGVNAFIDHYLNVACLRIIDDYQFQNKRYVKYVSPNSKYIPEKLQRELESIYDSVVVDWSYIGGQITCKCSI